MRPRISVVIPTYNRKAVLLETLGALARVETPWPIEAVVVVDGSVDGSLEAARALEMPFDLRVIGQSNAGASAARNRGAAEARGELLLFLDDDMVADRRLLVAHDEQHRAGAQLVVGHIPLHPDSPHTLLTDGYERWVAERFQRLSRTQGALMLADLLSGQFSVPAELFHQVGGFDEDFTAGGAFGGEDTDLLYRILQTGARAAFAPGAVSAQRYVIQPEQYLRQWRQAGHADAALSRKHAGLGAELFHQHEGGRLGVRAIRALEPLVPRPLSDLLSRPVRARASAGKSDPLTSRAFQCLRVGNYWRGVREGGGLSHREPTVTVLAYHALEEEGTARPSPWSVTPAAFAAQVDALRAAGVQLLDADEFLAVLDGRPVTRPSVLVTFDDGYCSVLEHAAPVLREAGASAVAFVVSDRIGGRNEWDLADGAAELPLLDVAGLRALRRLGWEIGAHSRTHAHLTRLSDEDLASELSSRQALAGHGFDPVRLLAFPFGEHDHRVRRAAARAGFTASFALTTGQRRSSAMNRHALPRVEVRRDTTVDQLLRLTGQPPRDTRAAVEREARAVARRVRAHVG